MGPRVCVCVRGVLWYVNTYVGSGNFLGVQNFEFQFLGDFQKNKYFLGYEDFVFYFGGHHKNGLYLGVVSMHLGSFLNVKVQNGGIFGGC